MPLHVSNTCSSSVGQIALHSLWYHHTHRWPSREQGEKGLSVINQLDAQSYCFTIDLFNASACFEHMCSS